MYLNCSFFQFIVQFYGFQGGGFFFVGGGFEVLLVVDYMVVFFCYFVRVLNDVVVISKELVYVLGMDGFQIKVFYSLDLQVYSKSFYNEYYRILDLYIVFYLIDLYVLYRKSN